MSIKIQGLKGVNRVFKTLDNLAQHRVLTKLTTSAYKKAKDKALSHYVTGIMHRNTFHDVRKTFGVIGIRDTSMLVNYKGRKINYASFVLYGTKYYKGDNFLHNSVKSALKEVDKLISEELNKI